MDSQNAVNPHYLNHMVKVGEEKEIEANEDILSGNGIKVLAKGATIDASVRERLMQHKLRKPLEECVRVVNGVEGNALGKTAQVLLDQYPLMKALFNGSKGQGPVQVLQKFTADSPLQSLLTIYTEHGPKKREHAVGVSLLCLGLANKVGLRNPDKLKTLTLAGLYHDVGELYIDPKLMSQRGMLSTEEWKPIAAHPVVGHRVLQGMGSVGEQIGPTVLNHHERLDGFGYPGLTSKNLPLESQLLAASEMLIGLLESGRLPYKRAGLALRMIPGEFAQEIIDAVMFASRECGGDQLQPTDIPLMDELTTRMTSLATIFTLHRELNDTVLDEAQKASAPIKLLIELSAKRAQAIRRAFTSAGLDTATPEEVVKQLAALDDSDLMIDMGLVLRELQLRLAELEREMLLRTYIVSPNELPLMQHVINMCKPPTAAAKA